jgi:hypothetical protein
VLISGLMDGWSARERWRREALLARLGLGRIVASEKRGAEGISESGMEWMNGSTKRQCDRTLGAAWRGDSRGRWPGARDTDGSGSRLAP